MLHMSSLLYPRTSSGSLSFQDSTVSPLTSPESPQILTLLTLYCFFHFSNHPLIPLKSLNRRLSAISRAFSASWGPLGKIFLEVASWCHLYSASFTCANAELRGYFLAWQDDEEALALYNNKIATLLFKTLATCVFPRWKRFASVLTLVPGLFSAVRISSTFFARVRQVLLFAVESAIAVAAATIFVPIVIVFTCSACTSSVRLFFSLMASQAASGSNACGFVELDSYVRGHHAYQDIWTPFRGEVLQLKKEPDNSVDQNAVAIAKLMAASSVMWHTI